MPARQPGPFSELILQWRAEQDRLRARMVIAPLPGELPRFIAGADAAFSDDKQKVYAGAVVYDRIERRIVEVAHATARCEFPYIPTFLSFREGPAVLAALGKLKHGFDVVCFDGQGYAHPRRCGLAAHMAITLDVPGVGIAKSRLIGTFEEPPAQAGSSSPLMDQDEQIGLVLRTRDSVKPLFVSVGHKIDLDSAKRLALACCTRYRIPEPTRQADIEVAKLKKSAEC